MTFPLLTLTLLLSLLSLLLPSLSHYPSRHPPLLRTHRHCRTAGENLSSDLWFSFKEILTPVMENTNDENFKSIYLMMRKDKAIVSTTMHSRNLRTNIMQYIINSCSIQTSIIIMALPLPL